MKAYYSTAYGGNEKALYGDYPDPVASDGQLLVEIKAVSINPVDYKIRRGDIKIITGPRFPRIYGSDFSGIVRETGSGVTGFKAGDRVYGVTSVIFNRQGAMAELLAVDTSHARLMPPSMSFEEAASLPVAALTALNGLRRLGVTAGTNVLVNGATGGVGHFAVQAAKAIGADVTASCSPSNATLAKELGADSVTGYTDSDVHNAGVKYDVIMDAYGLMKFSHIRRALSRGGRYATTMVKPFLPASSFISSLFYGIKMTSSNIRTKPEDLEEMEKLFLEGRLKPVIENRFTLENAGEAFALAEKGGFRGKIIVRVVTDSMIQ